MVPIPFVLFVANLTVIFLRIAGVPFLAPFTGAEFLRDPELNNVLNVRASYYQETDGMPLKYGSGDNQGSDAVFLTVIGTNGQYHGVEKLKRPQ